MTVKVFGTEVEILETGRVKIFKKKNEDVDFRLVKKIILYLAREGFLDKFKETIKPS